MKRSLFFAIAAVLATAWLSLVPVYYLVDGDKRLWAIWVTTVAITSELGISGIAALLGITALLEQHDFWRRLMRHRSAWSDR